MWVQWTSIDASRLKKHPINFWKFNFLIKGLKALFSIKGKLNKEKP
jgi:lipid-A-disaccharide synthase-like uncharacterized protein